ncbi:hypothetical protein FJZ17_03330, partial [Candidatus Pacearchaeota archaeon]|nr:hypothetical protein [Candidatus Pacearchaeota archaeon]
MTFKKYSVKNGKKYGPYIYHNQRVGEKVVTHYVGKGKSNPLKEKKYLLPWLVFGILLLIIAVFAFFFNAISPTGLVIMEIKPQYELGEPILGLINFNFKSGELIPADSKITVSLGSQRKELALSDLIEGNLIEGDYYAEQNPIEGSGFGYGAIGSKIVYPTLDFELSIQSEEVVEETSGETTENNQETETTETSPTDEGSNTETTETSNDLPAAPETPSNPTTETTTTESSTSDSSSSETSSSDSSSSSDSGSSDSGSSGSSSGDSSSGGDGGGMTGAVIGEDEYTINGQVSGEEDYDYNLEEGQTAVLVPGSVKYNGTTLEDSQVNIKIKNGKVIVTTDYSFVEEGFGRDFLGDFALSVPVDLKLFEIVAEEGALNAVLVYDETSLSRAKIDIGIKPNATLEEIEVASTIEVIQDIPSLRLSSSGRTIINLEEYFVNASNYELITTNITGVLDGHNMTLTSDPYFRGSRKAVIIAYNPSGYSVQSNEFNILVSSSNISITTEQGQVKVGEKVKWIKTVKLEEPEAVTIEIPAQSESIVVTKVEETISDSNSGEGLLTGNVVIDIELHKESPLLSWLKVVFNAMTGNVVESVLSESTEVVLDDGATEYQVEYYTEAPTKKEKRTSFGKQVTVSASDDLNYTNVLAFTEIQEIYSVGEENKIRVYWEEGARYLGVDAYDLNENGKLDYIEWIVPHLSDQNFRIILFDDVTAPTISFVSPTSADGSTTMTLKANISVSDASDSWYTFLK